jgi:hypothetical protein
LDQPGSHFHALGGLGAIRQFVLYFCQEAALGKSIAIYSNATLLNASSYEALSNTLGSKDNIDTIFVDGLQVRPRANHSASLPSERHSED